MLHHYLRANATPMKNSKEITFPPPTRQTLNTLPAAFVRNAKNVFFFLQVRLHSFTAKAIWEVTRQINEIDTSSLR